MGHSDRQTKTMTPLLQQLLRRIGLTGPIPFHEYWAICQYDLNHGYYTTRVPIGAQGDFTTAPEISQMFGELIAAWWLATVQQNELQHIHLVEIGPGRGTLMADMLRTLGRLEPSLKTTLQVHMVEVSPRLIALQKETLATSGFAVEWHETIFTLPKAPLGIIANELFDAIPVRPIIKHEGRWYEDMVTRGDGDTLKMIGQPVTVDQALLPKGCETQPDGAVFELAPAREAFMASMANMLADQGGFGLFIDYGHAQSGFGDTVQAMKNHAYTNPLEDPGEADLTSHVDFEALSTVAKRNGLTVAQLLSQGEFLTQLGIENRTERLIAARPDQRDAFFAAFERLTKSDQMGNLFKVLGIAHPSINLAVLQKSS
ncbi:MAG: class I SAM-dependent methyltransferase [Rhizobiaceae bacterium]